MEGFREDSELSLDDKKIPYYGIKLTPEQVKVIKNKQLDFVSMNGRTMFPIKDKEGKETGEYMVYVIWR